MSGSSMTFMVSLQEPVGVLRGLVYDYMLQQFAGHKKDQLPKLFAANAHAYDCGTVMTSMVSEIFEGNNVPDVSKLPNSVKCLIADGIEEPTARHIALQVFKLTLDSICAQIPGIRFGSLQNALCVNFIEGGDLMFSLSREQIDEVKADEEMVIAQSVSVSAGTNSQPTHAT